MRPRSQEIDTGVYVSSGLLHRSRVDEVEEPSQMLAIKLKDASQTQEVKYHMLSLNSLFVSCWMDYKDRCKNQPLPLLLADAQSAPMVSLNHLN